MRRPLLARGHVVDMCYLLAYALAVVPLIVLIDSGFSTLARHAHLAGDSAAARHSRLAVRRLAVVAIDFVDWLAHLGNHLVTSLWRLQRCTTRRRS